MKLITLTLILTLLTSCNGQNTSTTNKTPTNSLGDTVSALSKDCWIVFQATNGDYWFGSNTDGAYKYDGKTLVRFSEKDGLSNNSVRAIQEDKDGNIYLSTIGGISKFDGKTFTTLMPIKSNGPNENWKLQPDDLWFNTLGKDGENGPLRYDGKHLYQLEFPKHYLADDYNKQFPNKSWSPYDVYYIYKDSKGTMWFGTSNLGVCRYDGKSISWLYEDHLTNTPQGGSFGIRSILEDKEGKFWFCNTNYRYDIDSEASIDEGKSLIKYTEEKGIEGIKTVDGSTSIYYMSVVEDNNGNLWMATYSQGIWKYDGKSITHYPVKDGTKDVTVFSIYKDRKEGLWLGTHEAGLYKFDGKAFDKFELPAEEAN